MSDPNINLDTQKKRHVGPLLGMGIGIAVVAVLAVFFLGSAPDDVTDAPTERSRISADDDTTPISE